MDSRIKEILEELYIIDNSFRKNEKEIIQVITKMIELKPDTHFSEKFKLELKEKILRQINSTKVVKTSIFDNFFRSFSLILSGAIIASFFILTIFPQLINIKQPEGNLALNNKNYNGKSNFGTDKISDSFEKSSIDNQTREIEKMIDSTGSNQTSSSPTISSEKVIPNNAKNIKKPSSNNSTNKSQALAYVNISKVGDNAFGKISSSSSNKLLGGAGNTKSNPEVLDMKTMDSIASPASDIAPTSSKMQSNYLMQDETEIIKYTYSYTGELEGLNSKITLLKKVKSEYNNPSLLSYLKNLDLGGFDLKNTFNPKLTSFSFNEDRDYGLEYSVNLSDSNINVSKNIAKWPQTYYKDNISTNSSQIKLTDLPEDTKVIAFANDVIKKYNIDIKNYSKPFINNDWKKDYEKSEDKTNYYIPDVIEVVFPILIDGKTVYEDYGQIKGLRIGFDVKTLKLAQITGIERLSLESSNYNAITDKSKILDYIAKGGRNSYSPYYGTDTKAKNVVIHLKKPTIEYIHIFDYNNGINSEYFVPAYIFDTIEKPKQGEYFQDKVIVPLVKDIFESSSNIMR